MTTADLEEQLRSLYATIDAPAPPPSWVSGAAAPGATPARRRRHLRPVPAGAGLVAVIAAGAVAAGVVLRDHRGATPPAPPRNPAAELVVAVLPAGNALSCELPISALSNDHTTGFVTMRGGHGSFHAAQVSADATTYVPALRRWIDVLPQFVAPDGSAYVTESGTPNAIHVIDAHGDRTVLANPPGGIFAWTRDGLLLMNPTGHDSPAGGQTLDLDLLDPSTGAVTPVAPIHLPGGDSETGYIRAGDAVWTTAYDPRSNGTTVTSHDLATGRDTTWFDSRRDGRGHAQIVGADASGHPIVQLSDQDLFHSDPARRAGIRQRTVLLSAPHQATVLNEGVVGAPGVANDLSPESVTDGDQVWMGADDGGIWLYSPDLGLREVAKVTTSTHGSPGVVVSGGCR